VTRLSPGDAAPNFQLQDADGKRWGLSELRGQRIVLYFYPTDGHSRVHGPGVRVP
jgi:thioredoxin-dependent peroxiredoxin